MDIPNARRRIRHRESGQAVVMVTLGLVSLIGLLGLCVDLGYGYYLKQTAQSVADAAAAAAAAAANSSGASCGTSVLCQTGYQCPSNPTSDTNFGIGCMYGQSNASTGMTVTLSSGTGTTGGVSTTYWVQATASQRAPIGFASVLGLGPPTATASATAGVIGTNSGGCIYVLDPNIGQSMTVSGGSSYVKSNCGVYVDSTASNAMTVSGGATVTASQVDVVGSTSVSGGSTITPTAITGVAPAADPLASLPAPTFSGCDHSNFSMNGGTQTINAGVYCGGLKITGGTATLNPGTYIINGGGLTISGGNTSVTGNGVFFYNTASGYSYGPVTLSGGDNTTLTAPTSGTYQGILVFDDRTITSSAKNTISGGTQANFSGTIYMPSQQLVFSGGSTSGPLTMVMISDTLTISGGSYLAKDPTGSLTGMPSAKVSMIQ